MCNQSRASTSAVGEAGRRLIDPSVVLSANNSSNNNNNNTSNNDNTITTTNNNNTNYNIIYIYIYIYVFACVDPSVFFNIIIIK